MTPRTEGGAQCHPGAFKATEGPQDVSLGPDGVTWVGLFFLIVVKYM